MPDLTPRRNISLSPTEEIKRRRLELNAKVIETEIMRTEVDILELQETIKLRESSIEALRLQLKKLIDPEPGE